MGCTPLDVSRVFGPFPETEAVLTQAILRERNSPSVPVPLRPAISTEEALPYAMYLLPVRALLELSVLPRHEELLERGTLVPWRPTMHSVFYVSLESSSKSHPDPDSKRLDALKRLLIRMVARRVFVRADLGATLFALSTFRYELRE